MPRLHALLFDCSRSWHKSPPFGPGARRLASSITTDVEAPLGLPEGTMKGIGVRSMAAADGKSPHWQAVSSSGLPAPGSAVSFAGPPSGAVGSSDVAGTTNDSSSDACAVARACRGDTNPTSPIKELGKHESARTIHAPGPIHCLCATQAPASAREWAQTRTRCRLMTWLATFWNDTRAANVSEATKHAILFET
jgi:hypothetical protein